MTKAHLIEKLYAQYEDEMTRKQVAEIVNAVFEQTALAIRKEGRFSYPGFGTWILRKRKARKARNPRTGETIKVKASKSVGFRASKTYRETL
jgi:DNA-binding protein HU-beta